ncbi:hypothetical protein BP5796_07110 [Coleophoma crateriformis]|uniref:Rhodopsin domain-containing protein n=1 Tax=Coleophoma crateriformis TaxID=565419 RepID=A0A3D8RIB0_9HELO|nr:hypothetical protein BP5796_07110 [Coleophoma crateriformis]
MFHHSLINLSSTLTWDLASWRTRAETLKLLYYSFFALSWALVGLRTFVRFCLIRSVSADDLFLGATLVSYTACIVVGLKAVQYGLGSPPPSELQADDGIQLSSAMKYWFFNENLSILTVVLARITAAIYLRPATKPSSRPQTLLFAIAVLSTASGLAFFFTTFFQCSPVAYFWTTWQGNNGSCTSTVVVANVGRLYASLGCISDWALALLPLWLFSDADMNMQTRRGMAALCVLGIFAGVTALVRSPGSKLLISTEDIFYDCIPVAMSAIIEPGIIIIILSAASFRPLRSEFFAYTSSLHEFSESRDEGCDEKMERDLYRTTHSRPYNDFMPLTRTGSDAQPQLSLAIQRRHSQDLKRTAEETEPS